ncbi:MAG: hypothetical protein LBG59_00440 [Candidatus Peribacteria bacterium]|jgi:hypothetical protein|nr:hypothetical protein [Candidatus Peribacteria bacterium]
MAASMGVDALYFDVQDFYLQNKEDYIRQSRAQLKQAILQHLHNKKEGNVSLDEKIGSPDKSKKDWTLKEAWKSIFFLEAVDDDKTQSEFSLLLAYKYSGQSETEFLGSKDAETHKEFEKQKKKLNEIIALKMEYVKKSFGEENVVAGLKSSQGMHYLSQLLAESTFYAERKQAGTWEEKSFEDNKAQAQKEFLETIPDSIERRLDALYTTDKHFLYELYSGAESYAKVIQKDEDVDSETDRTRNQHLRQNVEYLGNYIKSLELGNSRGEQYRTQFSYGNLNYHYITAMLEHDFEMTGFEYQNFSADAVKTIAYNNRERSTELPVSDKCSQNVLYRLATEFYGYTGKNDAMELMQYYTDTEGEGAIHGLYYKDGRYINNDWAVDQKFDLTYLDDNNFSKAQTEKEVQKIVGNLLYENWATVNPTMFVNPAMYAVNNLVLRPRKSMIDTPTEAIDKYLNDEFETRFRQILKEELEAKTTEKKADIKHQIFAFIKEFSKDGGYVELPYYLVIAAKRAGLGDLEKTQFSYKNGKVVAVGQVHDLRAIGDLEVEKEFVEQTRDTFTPEEMQYINLVEAAHKQVEALRKIEGR